MRGTLTSRSYPTSNKYLDTSPCLSYKEQRSLSDDLYGMSGRLEYGVSLFLALSLALSRQALFKNFSQFSPLVSSISFLGSRPTNSVYKDFCKCLSALCFLYLRRDAPLVQRSLPTRTRHRSLSLSLPSRAFYNLQSTTPSLFDPLLSPWLIGLTQR